MKNKIKILSFFILVLLIITGCNSEIIKTGTIYYNKEWKETAKDSAYYYNIVTIDSADNNLARVQSYYMNGVMQMNGTYSSLEKKTREGTFTWYFENGNPSKCATFVNGLPEGLNTEWNEDGIKIREINLKNGNLQGEVNCYYPNGTLKRHDIYDNEKLIEGHCYGIDCKESKYYPFRTHPEYPGGENALRTFVEYHLVYPYDAVRERKEGKVYIQMEILEDGTVSNVKVLEGVWNSLDNEAIRVVNYLGKWIPGTFDGVPVKERVAIPIVFRLK